MRVERFFHIRDMFSPKGGATVRVVGDTEQCGQVDVQVVECSAHDNYSRKEGRSRVVAKPLKVVPLRKLPAELQSIALKAEKHGRIGYAQANFDYSVKYFLPKE